MEIKRNINHSHIVQLEYHKEDRKQLRYIRSNAIKIEGNLKNIMLKIINLDYSPFEAEVQFNGKLHKSPGYYMNMKEEDDDLYFIMGFELFFVNLIIFLWFYKQIYPRAFRLNLLNRMMRWHFKRCLKQHHNLYYEDKNSKFFNGEAEKISTYQSLESGVKNKGGKKIIAHKKSNEKFKNEEDFSVSAEEGMNKQVEDDNQGEDILDFTLEYLQEIIKFYPI